MVCPTTRLSPACRVLHRFSPGVCPCYAVQCHKAVDKASAALAWCARPCLSPRNWQNILVRFGILFITIMPKFVAVLTRPLPLEHYQFLTSTTYHRRSLVGQSRANRPPD